MSREQVASIDPDKIDFTAIRRRDLTEARLQGFLTAWANLGAAAKSERRKETLEQLRARAERLRLPQLENEEREFPGGPLMQDALRFISGYRDLFVDNAIRYQRSSGGNGQWLLGFGAKVTSFGENLAEAWKCEHAEKKRVKPLESKAMSLRALRIIHLFHSVSDLSFVEGNNSHPQFSPDDVVNFNPAQQLGDPVIVSLLYMLRKERKFRLCARPGCEAPFFVAERGSTRYCCVSCSELAAKASDMKYYEDKGADRRRERLETNAARQSRAKRRSK